MKELNKKTVMIVSPMKFPIPAVGGGAVETLITNLIEENEKRKLVNFVVVSVWDQEAEKYSYSNTKIFNFRNGFLNSKNVFFKLKYGFLRLRNFLIRKIFLNRLTYSIFKKRVHLSDLFIKQCADIAKKTKADYIVNEEYTDYNNFARLFRSVGKENLYYHIHRSLDEIHEVRKMIPNSISISNYVRDRWVVDKSLPGRNYIAYNCINENIFSKELSIDEKNELRGSLGIGRDDVLVLFVGRLIKEKGIKELIDAFEILDDKKIKLLLIGSVNFSIAEDTDFSDDIMQRIERMPNVIHIGYVENSKIGKYYMISDMQIVPSICQEGAGLTAVEGMSAGLPLITTISGGMVEYVDSECSVQLPIDGGLSKRLAEEIQNLANSPELRKKMHKASVARAKSFSCSRFYNEFLACFGIGNK